MATDDIAITRHSVLQCNWAPNLVFEIGTLHPGGRMENLLEVKIAWLLHLAWEIRVTENLLNKF